MHSCAHWGMSIPPYRFDSSHHTACIRSVTLLRTRENCSQSLSDSFEFPELWQPQLITLIPLEARLPTLLKKIPGQSWWADKSIFEVSSRCTGVKWRLEKVTSVPWLRSQRKRPFFSREAQAVLQRKLSCLCESLFILCICCYTVKQ